MPAPGSKIEHRQATSFGFLPLTLAFPRLSHQLSHTCKSRSTSLLSLLGQTHADCPQLLQAPLLWVASPQQTAVKTSS